jgi:ribose transport system ATP-binding protein
MPEPILQMKGITKRFGAVTALKNVNFDLYEGEVLALIGENGAGKSTLMKTLGGVHQPTAGVLTVDGKEVILNSTADANKLKIAFVHQELNVLDNIDIAGNIFLGREPLKAGPLKLIDRQKIHADTQPYLDRLGLDVTPHTTLNRLSIGQQQLVEIAKALSIDARIIIMDEPTSSLTLKETAKLLEVIADLKKERIAVIYISHRLGEIETCADRVVALRDGENAGELEKTEICHDNMVSLMVGRALGDLYGRAETVKKLGYFQVKDLVTTYFPQNKINFSVAAGEIFGFAGLIGAGRSEMVQTIFGVDKALGGSLTLDDQSISLNNTAGVIKSGIYLVPEDRKKTGLILDMTICENTTMASMEKFTKFTFINKPAEALVAEEQKNNLKTKAPSVQSKVSDLSGGNQQKVVLAKWMSMDPKVIIFDEPTRGIDIGAKSEIYSLMHKLAASGVAIIMVSSDMEEVLGLSDRIAVMHQGQIAGILEKDDFSEENVMQLAVGNIKRV